MSDSRNEELRIHNQISRMIKSQNLILKAEGREAFEISPSAQNVYPFAQKALLAKDAAQACKNSKKAYTFVVKH